MENRENSNDNFPIKPFLVLAAAYALYELINAIITAVLAFLMGLVYIALGVVGILALVRVYQYITDQQYGETRKAQQIAKMEEQRRRHISVLPEHLVDQANDYWYEKERKVFDSPTTAYSRLDAILDRVKQILSTFRRP